MTYSCTSPSKDVLDDPELDRPSSSSSIIPHALAESSLNDTFEVDDTVHIILDGGYKTVRILVLAT